MIRRLRALGLTNEHLARLRYANRQGIRIGDPPSTEWLQAVTREHQADLIVIDTAAAATAAAVNDNDEVTWLFTAGLRPIASELDAAVVVLHHERKPQPGQSRDPGQRTMGARQWSSQADTHLVLARAPADEPDSDQDATRLIMHVAKRRDGLPPRARTIAIVGHCDPDGTLRRMTVLDDGDAQRTRTKADELAQRIADILTTHGRELTRKDLIQRTGEPDNSTFDKALKRAADQHRITKTNRGRYAPGDPNL